MSTLSTDDFPTGLAKIEVKFKNYFDNSTEEIEVYSGFFGIRQYADKTIEPVIAWAVCGKKAKAPKLPEARYYPVQLKHSFKPWSPAVSKENQPVYDVKKFKTAPESMKFLKQYIQDSIASVKRFMDVSLAGQAVEFVVLSNGKTTGFRLTGKSDPQLLAYIEQLIGHLPAEWLPAMAKFSDMTEDYDETNKDLKMKVNSMVHIDLD